MDMKIMPIDEIEAYFERLDSDELIKSKITELTDIFLSDIRPNDRNKIALILSDYGKNLAVRPIIEMIERPITKGNRGTLLYALNDLDCSENLDLMFKLLVSDSFEVSREAFKIIEGSLKHANCDVDFYKRQIKLLIDKMRKLQDETEFYLSAFELLTE